MAEGQDESESHCQGSCENSETEEVSSESSSTSNAVASAGSSSSELDDDCQVMSRRESRHAGMSCVRHRKTQTVHYTHASLQGFTACSRPCGEASHEVVRLWDAFAAEAEKKCRVCFGYSQKVDGGEDGESEQG